MNEKNKPIKEPRYCPYCDEEIAEASFPYCGACEVEIFFCPECEKPVPREERVCPECGADIVRKAKEGD